MIKNFFTKTAIYLFETFIVSLFFSLLFLWAIDDILTFFIIYILTSVTCSLFISLFIILNPIILFNDFRTPIIIYEQKLPYKCTSPDIDEFILMYRNYKRKYKDINVYFERNDKKKGEIIAIIEYNSKFKKTCTINNLRTLEMYNCVWWSYLY